MKLEDILQSLPSKEDIANVAGLGSRHSSTADTLGAFWIFGTGMLLGAGLALLFAPKPGRALRHEIAEKVGEAGGRLAGGKAPVATGSTIVSSSTDDT